MCKVIEDMRAEERAEGRAEGRAEERMEIAIRGYEKVAKYHTYEIRLAQMIKVLTKSA